MHECICIHVDGAATGGGERPTRCFLVQLTRCTFRAFCVNYKVLPFCVEVCCSVSQCVTICCSVWLPSYSLIRLTFCSSLQCVAVCCSMLHCAVVVLVCYFVWQCCNSNIAEGQSVSPEVLSSATHLLGCVKVCYIVVQCFAGCCNVQQCAAACCSALQCVGFTVLDSSLNPVFQCAAVLNSVAVR